MLSSEIIESTKARKQTLLQDKDSLFSQTGIIQRLVYLSKSKALSIMLDAVLGFLKFALGIVLHNNVKALANIDMQLLVGELLLQNFSELSSQQLISEYDKCAIKETYLEQKLKQSLNKQIGHLESQLKTRATLAMAGPPIFILVSLLLFMNASGALAPIVVSIVLMLAAVIMITQSIFYARQGYRAEVMQFEQQLNKLQELISAYVSLKKTINTHIQMKANPEPTSTAASLQNLFAQPGTSYTSEHFIPEPDANQPPIRNGEAYDTFEVHERKSGQSQLYANTTNTQRLFNQRTALSGAPRKDRVEIVVHQGLQYDRPSLEQYSL